MKTANKDFDPLSMLACVALAVIFCTYLYFEPRLQRIQQEIQPLAPAMEDGLYTVYNCFPMFDNRTGEPIYWMVAGQGHYEKVYGVTMYIEPDSVWVQTIPQHAVVGYTTETIPCREANKEGSRHVDVKDGVAQFVVR